MHGKVLVASFNDNEDKVFQQTVEWLSKKLCCVPNIITEQKYDFTIDPFTRTFVKSGREKVYLSAKEFDLLYFLFSNKGQVFSKEQLYEDVWGYNHIYDARNLTSFIRKLRIKVEQDPNDPKYIITVLGVGYKFTENP